MLFRLKARLGFFRRLIGVGSKIICSCVIVCGLSVIIMVSLEFILPIFWILFVTNQFESLHAFSLYVSDYVVDSPKMVSFFDAVDFSQCFRTCFSAPISVFKRTYAVGMFF